MATALLAAAPFPRARIEKRAVAVADLYAYLESRSQAISAGRAASSAFAVTTTDLPKVQSRPACGAWTPTAVTPGR